MDAISIRPPFSPITNLPWRRTSSDHECTSHLTSLALPIQFTHSKSCFLLKQRNRRRLLLAQSTMSSSGHILQSNPSQWTELLTESDFEQIVSSDGTLSICGYGLQFSERNARYSSPELINFRVAKLNGFRLVFAHVAPIFFECGIAKPETKEISSLSVEPCEGESVIVTVFEIKRSEIPSFIEWGHEFRFLAVHPETSEGNRYAIPAVLCARYSDEEYFLNRCKGSQEIYHDRYGRFGIDKIWRDDVLPCRTYCRHCVLAAKNLGDEAYASFLDHTYLADRETTLRKYLATAGSGLMDEEPASIAPDDVAKWEDIHQHQFLVVGAFLALLQIKAEMPTFFDDRPVASRVTWAVILIYGLACAVEVVFSTWWRKATGSSTYVNFARVAKMLCFVICSASLSCLFLSGPKRRISRSNRRNLKF